MKRVVVYTYHGNKVIQGTYGVWHVALLDDNKIWDAGATVNDALENFVKSAPGRGLPLNIKDYRLVSRNDVERSQLRVA